MLEQKVTEVFLEAVKDDDRFQQAVEVVRANCQGKVYLIGGGLFRNIARKMYGFPQPPVKRL